MNDNLNNSSFIIYSQVPKKIISFITILIITFIVFIIVSTCYKYPRYLNYRGNVIKGEDKYLIKTLILEDDLLEIKTGKLLINGNNIDFKINDVGQIYYLDQQEQKYYEVILNPVLSKEFKYDNLPVVMKFELPKTTLIKELVNKLKKGMM